MTKLLLSLPSHYKERIGDDRFKKGYRKFKLYF